MVWVVEKNVNTWEKKADETLAEDFVGPAIL